MLLLIAHIIFIRVRFFLGDAAALLRESYTFLYKISFVSFIIWMKLMFLEFERFIPPLNVVPRSTMNTMVKQGINSEV